MMPKPFWVALGLSIVVFASLHVEWRRHRRALSRIPIRIHVNGTRGKSSVTRLIAAALRDHGVPTVAKTTGTSPLLILPDGTEVPVQRDGPPKIRELIWAMRRASRLGARAVVFECMAVDPDLQAVAEHEIMWPTLMVVTNARLDHTDVQGTDPREVAAGFAVRCGGTLVTADPLVAAVNEPVVRATGGEVHLADPDSVRPRELRAFGYLEHPANVAVALEAARLLGIARGEALCAFATAAPDPGVASVIDVPDARGPWTLVNLFAANDSQSTFLALDTARAAFDLPESPVILFASRADRSARSAEFASALAEHRDRCSRLVVWGDRTRAMVRKTRARGFPAERIVDAGSRPPEALTDLLMGELDRSRVVVGVGNIVGHGQRWLSYLAGLMEADRPQGSAGLPVREEVPA